MGGGGEEGEEVEEGEMAAMIGVCGISNVEFLPMFGVVQVVKFETWSRFVQQIKRSSTIDHIYTDHPKYLTEILPINTEIGDHKLITCKIVGKHVEPKLIYKRNWRYYSKEKLVELLSTISFNMNLDCVQETWNRFENNLDSTVIEQ